MPLLQAVGAGVGYKGRSDRRVPFLTGFLSSVKNSKNLTVAQESVKNKLLLLENGQKPEQFLAKCRNDAKIQRYLFLVLSAKPAVFQQKRAVRFDRVGRLKEGAEFPLRGRSFSVCFYMLLNHERTSCESNIQLLPLQKEEI